jgi:hypothetical protein
MIGVLQIEFTNSIDSRFKVCIVWFIEGEVWGTGWGEVQMLLKDLFKDLLGAITFILFKGREGRGKRRKRSFNYFTLLFLTLFFLNSIFIQLYFM